MAKPASPIIPKHEFNICRYNQKIDTLEIFIDKDTYHMMTFEGNYHPDYKMGLIRVHEGRRWNYICDIINIYNPRYIAYCEYEVQNNGYGRGHKRTLKPNKYIRGIIRGHLDVIRNQYSFGGMIKAQPLDVIMWGKTIRKQYGFQQPDYSIPQF